MTSENSHNILRLVLLFFCFLGWLSLITPRVNAQDFGFGNDGLEYAIYYGNSVQLKCNKQVLNKTDSIYEIVNKDTSLQIIKTDFIYKDNFLSTATCWNKFESTKSDNPRLETFGTVHFFYSDEFDNCISNEVVEDKNGKVINMKLCQLSLDKNGRVDSGLSINLGHYLQFSKKDYVARKHADREITPQKDNKKHSSINERVPFFNLLMFEDEIKYLFRSSSESDFFSRNIGFPNLENPLFRKNDFSLQNEKEHYNKLRKRDTSGILNLRSGTKDNFFREVSRLGVTVIQMDNNTAQLVSVFHDFGGLSYQDKPCRYYKFYYRNNSIVIESIQFERLDSLFKNVVSLFYDVLNLRTTDDSMEIIDKQFQKLLKTSVSEKATLKFGKDGNISSYQFEDFTKGNIGIKQMEVKFDYYDKLYLDTIVLEAWSKKSYLKKLSTLIIINKIFMVVDIEQIYLVNEGDQYRPVAGSVYQSDIHLVRNGLLIGGNTCWYTRPRVYHYTTYRSGRAYSKKSAKIHG